MREVVSSQIRKLTAAEDGATMLEYGMLVLFIALAAVSLVGTLGGIAKSFLDASAYF